MTLSEALAERGIRPEVETGTCGGDECPSYDGKRCRQTGCRERGCPPAWEVFASLLAARAPSPSEGLREAVEALAREWDQHADAVEDDEPHTAQDCRAHAKALHAALVAASPRPASGSEGKEDGDGR